METTYYTLYTRQADEGGMAQVSGGEDRLVMFTCCPAPRKRVRREDNVISLSDYRARLEEAQGAGEADFGAEPEPVPEQAWVSAPRVRTDHHGGRVRVMELAACAAIICVAAAACVMLLI